MKLFFFLSFLCFAGSLLHADGRILSTPSAGHPQAEIINIDPANGVATYRWLDANGEPVDSGNSIARFTASVSVVTTDPETGQEVSTYPQIDDSVLLAAIMGPEPVAVPEVVPLQTFMDRLTDAEFMALDASTNAQVKRFMYRMENQGGIRPGHPDITAAITLLDSLGIIAAARWPTLLAP